MHRQLLYDAVDSQIFNDQFEVPGLEFLTELSPDIIKEITDKAFDIMATSISGDVTSANSIASAIGDNLKYCCDNIQNKRIDSAAKLGTFFLFCFSLLGLIEVEIEDGEGTIVGVDTESISKLWKEREKVYAIKPTPFPINLDYKRLMRRSKVVLSDDECPIAINMMRRLFKRGWVINQEILAIALRHFQQNTQVFKDYCKSSNPIARDSKKALCERTINLAIELQSITFYHRYFFDFRGRVYPVTGFLHEQGNDLAKGLILLSENKPLGEFGFKWIKHSLASNWAGDTEFGPKSDKLSLEQRCQWVDNNKEIFISYAKNPDINIGWMQADCPWQFLATCLEYNKILNWELKGNNISDFHSHLVCYMDGSCNGSQHLAALTRDENTALHVNLRANKPIGDLYKYISEFIWRNINSTIIDNSNKLNLIIDEVLSLNKQLSNLQDKAHYNLHLEVIKEFRNKNIDDIKAAAPLFWKRITEPSHRRKIVKRGVMTMVYGVTRYGAGEQIIEDTPKHNIDLLEGIDRYWAIWLGQVIYDTMFEAMPTSAALLKLFETAGKRKGNVNKSLAWKTPIVNFPVVQDYRVGDIVKVKTQFYNENLIVSLRDPNNKRESPSKQKAGAPPNIVHSLDATHLMLTSEYCKESLVTVHDSFGTLAGGMEQLHKDVRKTFIMLYYNNPLYDLMKQLGIEDLKVNVGNFDISEVYNAEFCFI